jgi:hypothetical protein
MTDTARTPASNHAEPIALDARTRRVLELKRQIREGTYRPDSKAIARAILSHWFAVGLELENEQSRPVVDTPQERREAAARFLVAKTEPERGSEGKAATA